MARWRVTFEIDLPTDSYNKAAEWAEFVIGFNCMLKGGNPCSDIDLPASIERDRLSCPRVDRVG